MLLQEFSSSVSRSAAAVCCGCVLVCTLILPVAAKPSAEDSITTHPKNFLAGHPASRSKAFDSLQADDYSDMQELVNSTEQRGHVSDLAAAALPVNELSVCIRRCSEACTHQAPQPQPSSGCNRDDSEGILTPLHKREAIGGSMFAIAVVIVLVVWCRRK